VDWRSDRAVMDGDRAELVDWRPGESGGLEVRQGWWTGGRAELVDWRLGDCGGAGGLETW
jgi:hypothetical protein